LPWYADLYRPLPNNGAVNLFAVFMSLIVVFVAGMFHVWEATCKTGSVEVSGIHSNNKKPFILKCSLFGAPQTFAIAKRLHAPTVGYSILNFLYGLARIFIIYN